jgi:hypothetical protein
MTRGWNEAGREKGVPHRHTRAKIRLLLSGQVKRAWLEEMLLKLAEKRPDDVLDAVSSVLAVHEDELPPDEEFRRAAAGFIARNDDLLRALEDDGVTAPELTREP